MQARKEKRSRIEKDSVETTVLGYLGRHKTEAYSAHELARKLKIKKKDFKAFRRVLRQLARRKQILELQEGIFQSLAAKGARGGKKSRPGLQGRGRASDEMGVQGRGRASDEMGVQGRGRASSEMRVQGQGRASSEMAPSLKRRGKVAPAAETIEGTLQQYRAGFAFVTPAKKDREDIFIPPGATGGALNGDKVLVQITR